MKRRLIYVVDDELNIRELIKTYLIKEGYLVETFQDAESVLQRFEYQSADMLIIDIMMPGMDGYSLCGKVRKKSEVPIIMVSAKDEEIDRILGLELGSDDYISKPFSPKELVTRVKTIFRRIKDEPQKPDEYVNKIECRDITVLTDERRVMRGSNEIAVTSKEYDFLVYLIQNRNRVFTREQLISGIWGYEHIGDERAVDDLVKRIRRKLTEAGSCLEITTVWGYGYKVSG